MAENAWNKKTEAEYKKQLTAELYRIARLKGTEAPFSGTYLKNNKKGRYLCAVCGQELFSSQAKFESGCGWPSFFQGINELAIVYKDDHSLGMHRIEILCSGCESHIGHVFEDGPEPTGKRYCLNSISLKFVETEPLV